MRKLSSAVALVAVLGWAAAAHAGHVSQSWQISDAYGATGATKVFGFTPIPTTSVNGTLKVVATTQYSSFTSSVPPASAWIHVISQNVKAQGYDTGNNWKVQGSVKATAKGSTQCHVGASGMIAGSCSGTFYVRTYVHCASTPITHTNDSGTSLPCRDNLAAPGNWTGNSDMHTQTWTAKSIHLGGATVSHTAGSAHYLQSFQATMTPPDRHTFFSGGVPHLASSNRGYHTFHVGAKQTSP